MDGYVAERIKLRVHPRGYHIPLVEQGRRVGAYRGLDGVGHGSAVGHRRGQTAQRPGTGLLHRLAEPGRAAYGILELQEVARAGTAGGHLRDEAFEVAHRLEGGRRLLAAPGVAEEMLHYVEPAVDGGDVEQREKHPAAQQARAHRRGSHVDHVHEAAPLLGHRLYKLEVAHGEAVEAHVPVLLDAAQGGDVAYVRVLREVEVMDEASGGDDGLRHVCHAEALEARRAEMLHEPLLGRLRGVDPVVHLEDGAAVAHGKLVGLARALHPQHLLGGDVGDELLDVFRLPARTQELARGYVEEGHAREMLPLVCPASRASW